MIYDTLEQAQDAQKSHFERVKSSYYKNATEDEKKQLDDYYKVTNSIYDIQQTSDGKFEYPENEK